MQLEQWGMPLAVVGMLLLMLFMASALNRYQAHQSRVHAAVRRLEAGVNDITGALSALRSVPLSRELRVTLRGEVLARYQKIRRLYRRYPSIVENISAAETALNAEGAQVAKGVGPIDSDAAFRTTIGALDILIETVSSGYTLQPIPRDVRTIFGRELGERRAEVASRFHLVQARRHEDSDSIGKARAHLTTLMQILRQRGPSTDFVRELYGEAEMALAALTDRQIGALSDTADTDRGDREVRDDVA